MHRVATSRRYASSLKEIMDDWCIEDVVTANEVLDALDDAQARAEEEAERHG